MASNPSFVIQTELERNWTYFACNGCWVKPIESEVCYLVSLNMGHELSLEVALITLSFRPLLEIKIRLWHSFSSHHMSL